MSIATFEKPAPSLPPSPELQPANVAPIAPRPTGKPKVVIIGGGFGGLEAVKIFEGEEVSVTLIDRSNHHLFQPLLYQVATAGLTPANIARPLREVFSRQENVEVVLSEVRRIDAAATVARQPTAPPAGSRPRH